MNYYNLYMKIIKNAKRENRYKTSPKNKEYIYYESHHIIPKCLCKNKIWKDYKTNIVLLTMKEHYICHILLTKIFPNNKNLIYACWWMSKCKKGVFYDNLKKQYSIIQSDIASKTFKGRKKSRSHIIKMIETRSLRYGDEMSKKMSGKNNIVYKPGVVNKILNTKTNTIIDGKNMHTIGSERAAKTMKKEYILDNGEKTTIYKENGKKISKYLLEEIIVNGEKMTRAKYKNLNTHKKLREKGKWYKLKNIFDDSFEKILCAADIRNISPGLEHKTKDNYLGKSKYAKTMFKRKNKENLIGLYVEQL